MLRRARLVRGRNIEPDSRARAHRKLAGPCLPRVDLAVFREVFSIAAARLAERARVRSWIFRHRLRLRAIYGTRPALRPLPTTHERRPRELTDGLSPGQSGHRGRWYVIRPNPPAA
jgi:hypothetical protein